MERTVETVKAEIDELWDKIQELRREKTRLEIAGYNFVGKYVKFKDGYENDYTFMYVYEMFITNDTDVLLRGVSFNHFETRYWDGSYFTWQTDYDIEISPSTLPTIKEITEEEYNNAFNDAVATFLKHRKEVVDVDMKKWAESNKKEE